MYNVLDFGAAGDGVTLDTEAIQAALDTCCQKGGGTVLLPGGHIYKSGSLIIGSDTELHLESGAVLRGSDRLEDYRKFADLDTTRLVPSYVNCEYAGKPANYFLFAAGAENVRITGYGTIDGSEEIYYGDQDRYFIDGAWYPRTPLLFLEDIRHLTVKDVTLTRSGFWTLHMVGCKDVLVDGIRILNNLRMANCDGIDPDHCQNVRIVNCHIESADDNIVLKTSGAYRQYGPTENVVISNCTLRSTSAAIKFGTESESDFRNILVDNCVITGSHRAVSLQLRDLGNIENVQISNLIIENRRFAPNYWGRGEAIAITALERHKGLGVGKIRNIRIRNVQSTGENGIFLYGMEENPIEDVQLENIQMTLKKVSRWPVDGYDLRPCDGDGTLESPVYGVYAHGVRGLELKNVTVATDGSLGGAYGGEIHDSGAESTFR
ncbi:MAG: right-handed parallel beta-helix repeat-containing protein [Blautia sp.]|nr:right-handed parallel beta-helix repeat-containing protein [Blautia sp.]